MKTILRQGDVLLVASKRAPAGKVVESGSDITLALGEATGHSHRAITETGHAHEVIGVDNADPVPAMELFEEGDGSRILVVKREALLRHEEHGKIPLAPGNYEVIRQREYSPEAIRNVAD